MSIEERSVSKDLELLKRSIEEAEIIKTGMKLVLMNPSLNSESKDDYEKAFAKLNDEIRELKMKMDCAQKITPSSKNCECET